MAKITRHSFTVRMTGYRPPFDMLRYDACWPASSEDATKLENMMREFGGGGPIEVTFETDNPHAPTTGRWESFNCRITPEHPDSTRGYVSARRKSA